MKEWWQSLEQRERYFVGGLGVFLGVFLFYMLLLEPLLTGAAEYREKVATAEQDLAWMQRVAPTLQRAGPREPAGQPQPITAQVDRTLRRFALRPANMQAVGDDGLRVRLDDASFDAIVGALGNLNAQLGVSVESASVRPGELTGTANATLTLRSQ